MANTNAPFGFRFLGLSGGSAAPTASQIPVHIAYDAGAIYYGDPVKMTSDGVVAQWTNGTAVSQLWGIFVGCQYLNTSGSYQFRNYWAGSGTSGAGTANVLGFVVPCIGSPPPLFVVQTDSTGITQAAVGANADVTVGTGNTTTGISGAILASASATTTPTLPFRIVGLYGDTLTNAGGAVGPGSGAGAYNWAIVTANVQQSTGI